MPLKSMTSLKLLSAQKYKGYTMSPLLALLPSVVRTKLLLKKVFTNKYVLFGIAVVVLFSTVYWAIDTHYELVNEYKTISKNHVELIKKEKLLRGDYNKQIDIIKDNIMKTTELELEYSRVKTILENIDFTKFKDASPELIKRADRDINFIINNSYGCIEMASGNVGATCVK